MTRLAYLRDAYRLKERPRTGWGLRGVVDGESVADHSWGTSLLCLLFAAEAGVDRATALEIAVVHDLAEAETGDLPHLADPDARPVGSADKVRLEADAMAALTDRYGGSGSRLALARWRSYEERDGPEAVFVRDMNLVDMALQAWIYAETDRAESAAAMDEFLASAEARASSDFGRALVAEIVALARAGRGPAAV